MKDLLPFVEMSRVWVPLMGFTYHHIKGHNMQHSGHMGQNFSS